MGANICIALLLIQESGLKTVLLHCLVGKLKIVETMFFQFNNAIEEDK